MAVRDEKEMTKSKATAISWVALSLGFAVFIGILGRAYLPELVNGNHEKVFIEMIKKVFTVEMRAPFIAGLFLCGILAAIMSTADSQLLVSASSVAEDIFKGLLKKDADDKTVMNVSRVTVLVVAVLAYIIAWNPNNTVMGLVSNAWAGLGAAFGPLVVMSLYWKRTNFPGAVAGIVTGALAVIIWDYIPLVGGQTLGKATGLYSLVVGFGLGLIAIIAVTGLKYIAPFICQTTITSAKYTITKLFFQSFIFQNIVKIYYIFTMLKMINMLVVELAKQILMPSKFHPHCQYLLTCSVLQINLDAIVLL
jgi:sodium/proline symporter